MIDSERDIDIDSDSDSERERPHPHKDPTPRQLAELTAAIRSRWSDAEMRRRACVPEVAPWFHLAADVMGADPRVSWLLFHGEAYRPEPVTVPVVKYTPGGD